MLLLLLITTDATITFVANGKTKSLLCHVSPVAAQTAEAANSEAEAANGWPPTAGRQRLAANGWPLRSPTSAGRFPADDDLGLQPFVVKLPGGPAVQMHHEQLWQTNDEDIPGFEGLMHRSACRLAHDCRFSANGWISPGVACGPLQLGL